VPRKVAGAALLRYFFLRGSAFGDGQIAEPCQGKINAAIKSPPAPLVCAVASPQEVVDHGDGRTLGRGELGDARLRRHGSVGLYKPLEHGREHVHLPGHAS